MRDEDHPAVALRRGPKTRRRVGGDDGEVPIFSELWSCAARAGGRGSVGVRMANGGSPVARAGTGLAEVGGAGCSGAPPQYSVFYD